MLCCVFGVVLVLRCVVLWSRVGVVMCFGAPCRVRRVQVGKPADEVVRYGEAFWRQGPKTFTPEAWRRIKTRIENREKKLAEVILSRHKWVLEKDPHFFWQRGRPLVQHELKYLASTYSHLQAVSHSFFPLVLLYRCCLEVERSPLDDQVCKAPPPKPAFLLPRD